MKDKASSSLNLIPPIEWASPELECIDEETSHPGIVFYEYGDGRSVYIPWELSRLSYEMGLQDHASVMHDVIQSMVGEKLVFSTDAPSWVETTLHRQPHKDRWILHLVNESGQDNIEWRDPVCMIDIQVRIRQSDIKCVTSMRLLQNLPFRTRDGFTEFVIPELRLFDLIVIE